ncbi:hypothetical protein [Pseudoxanthomonas mexicana]
MASRKPVTLADHERLQFARWVLFVLAANEAAGLPPVTRHRLHALLFMSFASSRYYGITPLRQRARRTEHGPYYRWAHIALGGLVLAGLVSLEGFRAHPKPRDLQFEGVFRPTLAGLKVARTLRKTLAGRALYQFLLDLSLAAARTMNEAHEREAPRIQVGDAPARIASRISPHEQSQILDEVLEEDLTYQQAVQWHGDSLDHRPIENETTPTVAGLSALDARLQRAERLNRKDILTAYQSVLLKRAQREVA